MTYHRATGSPRPLLLFFPSPSFALPQLRLTYSNDSSEPTFHIHKRVTLQVCAHCPPMSTTIFPSATISVYAKHQETPHLDYHLVTALLPPLFYSTRARNVCHTRRSLHLLQTSTMCQLTYTILGCGHEELVNDESIVLCDSRPVQADGGDPFYDCLQCPFLVKHFDGVEANLSCYDCEEWRYLEGEVAEM